MQKESGAKASLLFLGLIPKFEQQVITQPEPQQPQPQ